MATGGGDSDTKADDTVNKLTCAICLEQYRRPKLLPCFHTFCQSCLQNIAGTSPSLACPSCRSPVLLPPGGVKRLQSNFYIEEDLKNAASSPQPLLCDVCTEDREATHTCIQCQQRFCLPCRTCHNSIRLCQGHTVVPLTPEDQDGCGKGGASPDKAGDQPQQVCSKHPDQRLVLHCKQCQADICLQCKLTQHDGHPAEDLVDIQAKAKTSLQGKLQEVTQQRQQISHLIVALDDRRDKLAQQQQDTERETQERADTLRQWVNQSADDMLTSIRTTTRELDKPLQDQIEQLKNKDLALQAQQEHMAQVLKDGQNPDIVSLEAQLSASLLPSTDFSHIEKELTADIPKLEVKHSTSAVSQLQLREFVGVLQPVHPESLPVQPSSAGVSTVSANSQSLKSPVIAKKKPPRELEYSKNPESSVIAMCPISQNRLWVMYSPARGAAALMKLFDADGQVLATVKNAQPCTGLIPITDDNILAWIYQDQKAPLQLISPDGKLSSHNLGMSIGHLVSCATNKKSFLRENGVYEVYEVKFTLNDRLTVSKATLSWKNSPGIICPGHASSESEYIAFAVDGAVKVYDNSTRSSSVPFSSYTRKQSRPTDVRFCQVDGKEQLLVLVNDDTVHVVDHTDGGAFVRYLDTRPLKLNGLRCLATNFDQRLWIGCRGGTVAVVDL